MPKELPGRISFARVSSSMEDNYMEVTLEDESSSTLVVKAKMSMEDFALMVTGQGHLHCTFRLWGQLAGMALESKEEVVSYSGAYRDKEAGREALRPFVLYRWKGRLSDVFNHHRSKGSDKQRVLFQRYVEPQPNKEST